MGIKENLLVGETATVAFRGEVLTAKVGDTLSAVIHGEKPCGGHGKCGKCKVIVTGEASPVTDAERECLSDEALTRGVRLACMTKVTGDCRVFSVDEATEARILTEAQSAVYTVDPTFCHYGVAIDVGTTTLVGRLYNDTGECLAEDAVLNPQSRPSDLL